MLSFATMLARTWIALYTRGLPADLRNQRRDEIESDLWEQRQAGGRLRAVHIILRSSLGAPADLVWRIETSAALRAGKDPNMKDKPWNVKRILALLAAIVILPIPPSWLKSWLTPLNPQMKEESTASILLLGLGGNVALMPLLLGGMTIFWETPNISRTEIAWGSAEIVAGLVALYGIYIGRGSPALAVALIAGSTAAMTALAFWAFPAVIILGVVAAACAVGRHLAPAPATPAIA